jgi:hypothetical protein
MTRRPLAAAVLLALAAPAAAQDKLTLKVEDAPPPKELAEPVRTLLDAKGLSVYDGKGKLICTVWPRKALEAKAGADATALRYTSLEETTLIGAVRFPEVWVDYRKQKVKPGVYTLRLGNQPMDGDHMGTAPYNEFCLLCPADHDKRPDTMDPMEMHELSAKSVGRTHPGIMLLFPNPKPADAPAVEAKPREHWVLSFRTPVTAGGQKAALGFSLVVVGVTMAE